MKIREDNGKKKLKKKSSVYGVWTEYNKFIRNLHLEKPVQELTTKQLIWLFLNKLIIVFLGSFFTTFTFFSFIDPNGLYNGGLNGLLQIFSKLMVGYGGASWSDYPFIYYGLALFFNILFVIILKRFFAARLEIIIFSVFYVIFQKFWTLLFNKCKVKSFIFSRFNPTTWKDVSKGGQQLSFTLPYYIVIAIVAAIIHTFGYSLIYQAQATPGGFDVFSSHFKFQNKKNKKKGFPLGLFMKLLSFAIITVITVVNFINKDNPKMIKSDLKKELIEKGIENPEEEIEEVKTKIREYKDDAITSMDYLRFKKKKEVVFSVLKYKISPSIEKYPEDIDYYIEGKYKDKKSGDVEFARERRRTAEEEEGKYTLEEQEELLNRELELEKRKNKNEGNFLLRYLSYVTNDEKFWATLVYIFMSSYLIGQIFPSNQMIMLSVYSSSEKNRDSALFLLKGFSPFYYNINRKRDDFEEIVFATRCYLSKWNYYLLKPQLEQVGIIIINETEQ